MKMCNYSNLNVTMTDKFTLNNQSTPKLISKQKSFLVSPDDIIQLLKVGKMKSKKNIRRVKTAVITESPYKNVLYQQEIVENIKEEK